MNISKKIPNHKIKCVVQVSSADALILPKLCPICVISTCYPQKNAPEDIENLEMQLKSF